MFKIWCRFQKWIKAIRKSFGFKDICFWIRTTNSLKLEKDTCHCQSMCYKTSLRFNISLREMFFKSGSIRLMEEYDEIGLMPILQGLVWDPLTCWLSKGVLKRCFLGGGLTKFVTGCNFRNKVAITIIFCSKYLKFDEDCRNSEKKKKKKRKKVFGVKDNWIWVEDNKFSQSRKGYLPLALNALQNIPKI